jgi:predicted Zn-dependent protease
LTVAGDLVTMLTNIGAVGSETRWVPFGGSVKTAPVLVSELAVSGS